MSGNFLSCSKGVKDPLEVPEVNVISLEIPQRKWASCRLEGRTSWIFSSWGMCSRLTTGTSWTRSGGLRKGQSPSEFLGGLSGFLSRRCRGLSLPGASVRKPARDKVMRKEADIRKACSDFRDPSGNSKGSFTPLLQLKKYPDIPVSTGEEARESRPHPEEPCFHLIARED